MDMAPEISGLAGVNRLWSLEKLSNLLDSIFLSLATDSHFRAEFGDKYFGEPYFLPKNGRSTSENTRNILGQLFPEALFA